MYPVDLHTHTISSTHAYSSIHDYIIQARKKAIKLIAITDHGPDMIDAPHQWHFINMRTWPRIIEGVGILRGIEANIKNVEGDIDCTDLMLTSLDLIIAGFHEPVFSPKDRETNTRAMLATITSGNVHIISHPCNPKFPINIQVIAEAAAKYRVALEINNSSFTYSRKGSEANCRELMAAVKEFKGIVALGSDSHISFTLGNFEQCKKILNELNFPEENILNSTPKKTLDFLESHGMDFINDFSKL